MGELIEESVNAVQKVFPDCCVQFEDWKSADALRVMERYCDKVLCSNDDVQGTASTADQ
ncbi:malate dehydrogenase [Pseudomonas syringae]|uniref:Malic enzyme N-terminal domain-containing protein n=1 Tax=Pseudomonas syringae pv. aceris TaxID=199198 RepID=A0A0L8IP04_PSESX|nr:malate dehydrogenase [Pseudomonas syringae]EGH72835.1 malate dehydrogenase [Pseudomonas syringae pv. aceris str. M302273]KOG03153.1 Malate dehydrogenase [Pseudomonas syringae pv. aceris]KPW20044.1 hypothetical protein ALO91_103176 [Pseudomonas syringae pv. aceris]